MTDNAYPPAPKHLRAACAHPSGHLTSHLRLTTLRVYLDDGLVYRYDGDDYRLPTESAQAQGVGPYVITGAGRRAILNGSQLAAVDSADEDGALREVTWPTAAALVRLTLVEYRDADGVPQPPTATTVAPARSTGPSSLLRASTPHAPRKPNPDLPPAGAVLPGRTRPSLTGTPMTSTALFEPDLEEAPQERLAVKKAAKGSLSGLHESPRRWHRLRPHPRPSGLQGVRHGRGLLRDRPSRRPGQGP